MNGKFNFLIIFIKDARLLCMLVLREMLSPLVQAFSEGKECQSWVFNL